MHIKHKYDIIKKKCRKDAFNMAGTLQLEGNLVLMEQLLGCGTNISIWKYGTDGHLSGTNSSHLVLDKVFENSGNKAYMVEHCGKYTAPLILGGQLGLMWCAVFERKEEQPQAIYVLGPVFNSEISARKLEQSIMDFDIDRGWRQGYMDLMQGLPVVSSVLFFQYALMVHYCVTGEKLSRSDLHFQKENPKYDREHPEPNHDRMRVWLAERALLNMVREGDLNYQAAVAKANLMSSGVRAGSKDPILQAIVSCTSFTSLCVREAIQAGISPDTAYSVGDSYIQSMVQCKTITELQSTNHAMYEDFIMRVHKHRTNPEVSTLIQNCRDYIESHTDRPLSLSILAKQMGYSQSHLSRKFKQEIGVSVTNYIQYARVERAKFLLSSTEDSIAKIALDLHFSSGSHFSDIFWQITGKKPQQYRREEMKIVIPK